MNKKKKNKNKKIKKKMCNQGCLDQVLELLKL